MPGTDAPPTARRPGTGLVGRVLRYGAGSVVATVCSEVTFLLVYGVLSAGTTWASVTGWLAGAVPNYWLNRSWAWERRGRPSLTREVVPYVGVVLVTLGLAVAVTSAVDAWLAASQLPHSARTTLTGAAFLGVYAVVFVLRFLLFDRIFRTWPSDPPPPPRSRG
jgi:putative flippase GtrA